MISIDYREIKTIEKLGSGNFGTVYKAIYKNELYCYKLFNKAYNNCVIDNINELTNINFEKKFIAPLIMVTDNDKSIGYLMNYNKNLINIKDIKNPKDQIILLRDMKKSIEKLHQNHNIIHCDLIPNNMLFDLNNHKSYLIDFDSSSNIYNGYNKKINIRFFIKDYIEKYGFNYDIDTYAFNISTLMILYGYNIPRDLLSDISYNDLKCDEKIRRLTKELLLSENNKKYSGEYIIDYI